MNAWPMIYLAGPITSDPMGNTRAAVLLANRLRSGRDVHIFVPHVTVLAEMICPEPYETWMTFDFAIIDRCQGLYRMEGESPGADREVEYATSLGLLVMRSEPELDWWLQSRVEVVS